MASTKVVGTLFFQHVAMVGYTWAFESFVSSTRPPSQNRRDFRDIQYQHIILFCVREKFLFAF